MRGKQVTILLAGAMLLLSGCADVAESEAAVKELRCEYRVNPRGIDVVKPRLSWILESERRGQMQSAYQILAASSEENLKQNKGDLWDSGKVESEASVGVVYKGRPLKSRMRCCWKVRVWDKMSDVRSQKSQAGANRCSGRWVCSISRTTRPVGLALIKRPGKKTPSFICLGALT